MVRAMITCPNTGKTVPTGFSFGDLRTFDSATIEGNGVVCAACGEQHLVDKNTIRVFPDTESTS